MNSVISLTEFEEQILQAMATRWREACTCERIYFLGYDYLHLPDNWAGDPQYVPHVWQRTIYPKLNFALGRLKKKGFVFRNDSGHLLAHGFSAGRWGLTDPGKLLLGIE